MMLLWHLGRTEGRGALQVWDSNTVVPVALFRLQSRVFCAAMSPLAHAHSLVAVGTQQAAVPGPPPLPTLPTPPACKVHGVWLREEFSRTGVSNTQRSREAIFASSQMQLLHMQSEMAMRGPAQAAMCAATGSRGLQPVALQHTIQNPAGNHGEADTEECVGLAEGRHWNACTCKTTGPSMCSACSGVREGGPQVRLCDARSGAFTHELEGHTRAVWAVTWDPSSQWRLATGACDGQVTVTGSARRAD